MALLAGLERDSCLTLDQLDDLLAMSRHQISLAAAGLIRRGLLTRVELGCYKLTEAGAAAQREGAVLTSGPQKKHTGKRKPPRNTLTRRLWKLMRAKNGCAFTVDDLVCLAAENEKQPRDLAYHYIRMLCRVGYVRAMPVREVPQKLTSNGCKRYKLIRDTGPEPPVSRENRTKMHDPNTGEMIDLVGEAS